MDTSSILIIVAILATYFGGEKLIVLDHGVIVGSFAPGVKPYILPFVYLDASTVRTAVCTFRPLGAMVASQGFSSSSRTSIWSRRQVTFVVLVAPLARALFAEPTRPPLLGSDLSELWVFTARTTRRQQRAAGALIAALRASGAPGVEISESHTQPLRHVRATREHADVLAVPWHRRSFAAQESVGAPH